MDAVVLLLTIATFLLLLATGALVLRAVLGPDPDLEAPWDPSGRPLCGQASCRVDHRARNQWQERVPR